LPPGLCKTGHQVAAIADTFIPEFSLFAYNKRIIGIQCPKRMHQAYYFAIGIAMPFYKKSYYP